MHHSRLIAAVFFTMGSAALPGAYAATAPTPVVIHLQDSSGDASMANMKLSADHTSVKAGRVTLIVNNDSKTLVHETIVVKVANPDAALPYNDKKSILTESKMKLVGDSSDLKPGAKKTMKLNLKPGTYVLICNEPGHYKAGMHAVLTVSK